jgi:hypothetical protein
MNLFVQGMRRSGTTIVYDALLEDPGLRCFYEPFTTSKEAVGGGSGAHEADLFASVRALREEFVATRYPELDSDLLNWGAPRAPELELEPDLPDFCREYLRFLLDQATDVVVKETRMYCKIRVLAEIDPDAFLLHLVRDPRAVVTSYLMGRGRKREERFSTADAFFERRSGAPMWASRQLAEALTRRPGFEHLRDCPDFMRVLVVWRFTFEQTRKDGLRSFGPRYRLVRHEDVRADPRRVLSGVYDLMQRPVPAAVAGWAERNIASRQEVFAEDDPRWGEAIKQVGLGEPLRQAGYRELATAAA